MTTTRAAGVTFQHILVPTDFSGVSRNALEYAKSLAQQDNCELVLAHVEPPENLMTVPEACRMDAAPFAPLHRKQLEQKRDALIGQGYRARAVSLSGPLQEALHDAIRDCKADLIVLGTHGRRGLGLWLLDSEAEGILRRAMCPVLAVGPGAPKLGSRTWNVREVLFATSFDPAEAECASYAYRFAEQYGAELVFFHAHEAGRHEDRTWTSFETAFRACAPEDGEDYSWVRGEATHKTPAESIVEFAKRRGASLIVMGAHGRSGLATHASPGIVARVLMGSPCPVLTMRTGEQAS